MGVVHTHRRRGIGVQLLAAVSLDGRRLGVKRLELEVFRSNLAAVSLYERAGFELEGKLLGARLLDGVSDDILLMCRWLDAAS
jgi:ribosomal protein S18 acetylase RimI-like enzyme